MVGAAAPVLNRSIKDGFQVRVCRTWMDMAIRGGDVERVYVEREVAVMNRRHGDGEEDVNKK